MAKYRKKPKVVEATQWLPIRDGNRWIPMPPAPDFLLREHRRWPRFWIIDWQVKTLEGWLTISPRDWIIMGVKDKYYPCKPDIFEDSYEEVVD